MRVAKGGAMKRQYSKPQIVQRERIEARAGACPKAVPGCGGGAAVS